MRYRAALVRAQAGGGPAGALAPPFLLARDRALGLRRTALHAGTSGHRRERGRGGVVRVPGRSPARRCAPRCRSRPRGLLPGRPGPAGELPAPARGRGGRPRRGRHRAAPARSAGGARLRRRGHRPQPLRPHAAWLRPATRRHRRATWLRGRAAAGVRDGRPRARSRGALPVAPRRPDVGRVAGGLRAGAQVTRGATSPYQAVVALEAWLRTTRAYDERASLPDRPDALALWAADGKPGTARCSPPRWLRSRGSPACRPAWQRDSPRVTCAAASTT